MLGETPRFDIWKPKDVCDWKTNEDIPSLPYQVYGSERHKEVVLKIIDIEPNLYFLDMTLGSYSGLDAEVANALIQKGRLDIVIRHADSFKDVDLREIAMLAIEQNRSELVLKYLEKFQEDGDNTLITDLVCEIVEKHPGRNPLEHVEGRVFQFVDHNQFVQRMTLLSSQYVDYLGRYRNYLHGLSSETAIRLIETRNSNIIGWMLVAMVGCFDNLDREVALKLIEYGGAFSVTRIIEKFSSLDQEVANRLARAGYGLFVVQKSNRFEPIDLQAVIFEMVSADSMTADIFRVSTFEHGREVFEQLDQNKLVEELIAHGHSEILAEHLEKLSGVNHKAVALKMIEAGFGRVILFHAQRFSGLDSDVTQALIRAGLGRGLAANFEEWVIVDPDLMKKLRLDSSVRYVNKRPS